MSHAFVTGGAILNVDEHIILAIEINPRRHLLIRIRSQMIQMIANKRF